MDNHNLTPEQFELLDSALSHLGNALNILDPVMGLSDSRSRNEAVESLQEAKDKIASLARRERSPFPPSR